MPTKKKVKSKSAKAPSAKQLANQKRMKAAMKRAKEIRKSHPDWAWSKCVKAAWEK